MKLATKIAAPILIAAGLFGLAGGTALAASAGPSPAMTQVGVYTRGFDITNLTKNTMWLSHVENPDSKDGYAPIGTSIAPGQTFHYEKVYQFAKRMQTTLTFSYRITDAPPNEYFVGSVTANLVVDPIGATLITVDADQFNVDRTWNTAVLMDKEKQTINVPASDAQKQAEVLSQVCGVAQATCTFVPTSRVEAPPITRIVAGGAHNMATTKPMSLTSKSVVGSTESVTLSASAKLSVEKVFEAGMTATYGKTFSKSHEFTETHNITVSPYTRVEVIGVLPMEKVTGDFTVTLGNTTYKLQNVHFTVPDTKSEPQYDTTERPLTADERAKLPTTNTIKPIVG